MAALDRSAPCLFEKVPSHAFAPGFRVDQQTSDEERRPFRRELRYERHDRSGRLGVQRDVPDDSLIAHGHPRRHRLGPGEEPREVPVGEEDGVAIRRGNASGDGDELVEVVVAARSDVHDS